MGDKTCTCIEHAERQLTEAMMQKYPNREVIQEVVLEPKFLYTQGFPLHFNAVGSVRYGKVTRKFDTYIVLNYCPFCGRKL